MKTRNITLDKEGKETSWHIIAVVVAIHRQRRHNNNPHCCMYAQSITM